ncbi:hypothetical protein ALI22I_01145 [Saccharothrix sp. ALI-22-I]|uniref:phage tail sheath C-terminal domain-containing protein n=1 Tax=Saccharothrix sp. ALI-22-I TaxID=1933778 RepID=UPI00097C3872|nr:phage tail sheath C-terminal domain-containing protein [Saccharothrix sp. ALI-22-I]ONI92909.1 hypothetical protein ALI22I_01145 [Saccharothrix sp. ALI-22-I]
MVFDIGVNVVEVDGATAPSVTGAAVSVSAFCVTTERGPANQPVRVTSFTQFVERFGGYIPGGFGAYLVKGLFDNGGRTAYVNRIVDPTGARTAKLVLKSGTGNADPAALTIEGGFRGEPDPGKWAEQLFVKIVHTSSAASRVREASPAKITGTALGATTDMSSLLPLKLEVDGAPLELTFQLTDFQDPAQATGREIKDAINAKTTSVVGDIDADKLVLTSTGEQAGRSSGFTSLKVTTANTALGLSETAGDAVLGNVNAFDKGGTTLANPAKFAVGDLLEITDGTNKASAKIATVDPATGTVTWTPEPANQAAFTDVRKITIGTTEFELKLAKGKGDDEHVVETHQGLSMHVALGRFVERVVNHPLSGSRFARVTVGDTTARPVETPWTPLRDGADGVPTVNHFIGDEAARTGFFAFDSFDVQLVCCERSDESIAKAALAYCEKRGDAMFVGAVPKDSVAAGQAVDYGRRLPATAYGAVYGPWIVVPDPIGVGDNPLIVIPPTGHVMGVYARTETTRGIWKAPAGDEANLRGVLDVETRLSAADHTDLVTNGSVNGIRAVPRAGIVVDASRTLSADPRWRYVNVRLLFNYVKSSLRDSLRWARQEPNRESLWTSVKYTTIMPFLLGLWRQGAFGTGTPDQTFTVIVDATNNPPDQVEQGRLTVEVYFYPSRPVETIVIKVGQQASGATVAET